MGSITRTIANNLTADLGGAGGVNFKNIVINGDMRVAQRATSKANVGFEYGTVDRFQTVQGSLGQFTQSVDTNVPTGQGFSKSLKMQCTTADASPASGDELYIRQMFEGQNLQYLKKGTANAQSLTVSFWVKSNKTGTYIVELFDSDNSRHINKSYTIDSADTWEKKTITYAGDTTGAFTNDNGASLSLAFMLGSGSDFNSGTLQTSWGTSTSANRQVGQVNLADSTSNYINFTGIQLEAGTSATDFEFLPYDISLKRCKRYYQESLLTHCDNGSTNGIVPQAFFEGEMRAAPTVDWEYPVNGTNKRVYRQIDAGTYDLVSSTVTISTSKAITAFYNLDASYTNWANAARGITTNFILDAEL